MALKREANGQYSVRIGDYEEKVYCLTDREVLFLVLNFLRDGKPYEALGAILDWQHSQQTADRIDLALQGYDDYLQE